MFSPYYAWARRRGRGDPLQHCALNVALYGQGGKRWALTERGGADLRRSGDHLAIGPSTVSWDGSALTIDIDEMAVPLPRRIRGQVRLYPASWVARSFPLDAAGRHRWSPLAACAHVEVALESPSWRWSGPGYLDTNQGDAPLEDDFVRWDWSRAALPSGTAVLYDAARRDGTDLALALHVDRDGRVGEDEPPPPARLPRTLWRVERGTRAMPAGTAAVRQTLEDTPFYARSVLSTYLHGECVTAMHESLSLDRFRSPLVQMMLPFRMPRRARRW